MTAPVQVKVLFAAKDGELYAELSRHCGSGLVLAPLDDAMPGQDRAAHVRDQFAAVDTLLVLLSADLMADQSLFDIPALRQIIDRGATVIPILARPCIWKESVLSGLLALPEDGRAVTEWENRDRAWVQ